MDGLVAVGVYGAAQPLSDFPEGFLPSDALELPSCSHPVQWIGDTLFSMDALTHGAAERAGPDLLYTVALISGVARLHMGVHAVFDVHPQCAMVAAVDVAGIPKDTLFPGS